MLDGLFPTDATEVERAPRRAPSVAQPSSPAMRGAGEDGPTVTGGPVQGWAGTLVTPRVIGLDLSLTSTGIVSALGWCELVGQKDITKLPLWERTEALTTLSHRILDLIGTPDLVVAEQVAAATAYGGASERAGLFWLVARVLRYAGIPMAEVPPAVLKIYATGKGSGKKGAVVDAVARRWPDFETGGDDNLCDAVVLAAMGADHLGAPLAAMPATHRQALKKVAWPEIGAPTQ